MYKIIFFILYIFFIYYNFYYIRVSLLLSIIPNEMLDYENNSSLSQINEKGW